jgi:LysM repeat protein
MYVVPAGEGVAEAAVGASVTGASAGEPAVEAADGQTIDALPAPDAGPEAGSVTYVVQAGDTLAAIARAYGVTVAAIVEANDIHDADTIQVGQELVIADLAQVPAAVSPAPGTLDDEGLVATAETAPPLPPAPALKQLADNDPGPPLTIEVSANRATQDPLVEKSRTYLVSGMVRNDGDQTYAVSAIHVTFYNASGFRGTFHKYPLVPGGEWLWHGQTEADFASLLLAPGEEWPFTVEITAQDMASFLIHPDAVATERESVPVELSEVRLVDEGTGYLRITGTASNVNPFAVQNVTVSGVLLDADGQIVSMGSAYVLEEDIAPGESVRFDLRVAEEPFTDYRLYAQAERDHG